jgi:hypothetical protein
VRGDPRWTLPRHSGTFARVANCGGKPTRHMSEHVLHSGRRRLHLDHGPRVRDRRHLYVVEFDEAGWLAVEINGS